MVYDWQDYRDVCYRMYIKERKSLEEIMQHMGDTYSFAPSKRAFQTQFRRWGFPSKQNPAHRNVDLVARVKELWEKNATQRDMLSVLNEEGYDIKERELMRVRSKNRWLLRVPNGMKTAATVEVRSPASSNEETGTLAPDRTARLDGATPQPMPLSPRILAKRKERLDKLQAESDRRWQGKKRRRRTRGWAGLPADPAGPPRFPSETTLDESKTYLHLDDSKYREIRDRFQRLCVESGIVKKTIAGPEKWQQVKDRLIQENLHLQAVFWTESTQIEAKALALDVVCTDVTKRMRTVERRMTITEAKNVLGINPEESRKIRTAFYTTLQADHFTSKLEVGEGHWQELKERWMQDQPLVLSILASGEVDPAHATKVKAIEVLCRDVMKRLRDDQTQRDHMRQKRSEVSPSTNDSVPGKVPNSTTGDTNPGISNGITTLASKALASTSIVAPSISDTQIDPSLLQAANDPSFTRDSPRGGHPLRGLRSAGIGIDEPARTVAVYLRPHPKSQMYRTSKVWLGTLSTRTVAELRTLLASKWPDSEIARIDGVEKSSAGQEISTLIEEDDELEAYLTHVQDRKATFVALMN